MGETNVNEAERRIQWYEAFVAAMKLELKDYAEHISFWLYRKDRLRRSLDLKKARI